MPKTISFHNGTNWSRGHNVRDERYTSKQEHINPKLSENNVTVTDVPIRDAYKQIFGEAVKEYNEKQKRADRRISDYYEKIKQDKRKHVAYECIIQIGDCQDTGNNAKYERNALLYFAQTWEQRNPNLKLIGAYLHADEPDGTVHLHMDYIPAAKCSRGMRLQNSLDRALQQQGFNSVNIHQTAQIAWQDSERKALERICKNIGIDVALGQSITPRNHLTTKEYQRAKSEQQNAIQSELVPLQNELSDYKTLKIQTDEINNKGKVLPLTGQTIINTMELDTLKAQAKSYIANRETIRNISLLQKNYDRDIQRLKARISDVEKREQNVTQTEKKVLIEYNRQKNINSILEKTEKELSKVKEENNTLNIENDSLNNYINERDKTISELEEQLTEALEANRDSYEILKNVVQAIGMLKYSKDEYLANLTTEQENLIDAIANYSAYWTETYGYPDITNDIKKHIGISEGIQEEIEELKPKIIDRGLSL